MLVISKSETFAKLFFFISFVGLFTYVVLAFYTFHTAYSSISDLRQIQQRVRSLSNLDLRYRTDNDLKYILLWTRFSSTVNYMGEGQLPFIQHNCSYLNCHLTTRKDLLNGDYRNFDGIVIDTTITKHWTRMALPKLRSPKQKFIFRSLESSEDHPVCHIQADNYFNWTWTYKLYTDIFSPFIEVKDLNGDIVAPNPEVSWKENMTSLTKEDIGKIKPKRKALAWKIRNCGKKFYPLNFVEELKEAFRLQRLEVDIYGCSHLPCPDKVCMKAIETDYYFYLAHEDSTSEDYVTTEVLKAYDNGAVPVVIGGADYTKFLPPGSYINARDMSTEKLAIIIDYSILNPTVYYNYHRWRKHYTIGPVERLRGVCDLCHHLNNESLMSMDSSYKSFRKWWYPGPLHEKCYPKGAENYDDVIPTRHHG